MAERRRRVRVDARRREPSRGTHPGRRHGDRRRTRLRRHQHRPGQRQVRAARQLDLLALQGQGRPDRGGHRTQLRYLAGGVAVPGRRRRRNGSLGSGARSPRRCWTRPTSSGSASCWPGAPSRRAARARDVRRGARPGVPSIDAENQRAGARPDRRARHQVATYAIAGADGLFIAKEIGGDSVDLSRCSSCTPARSTTARCA